MPTKEWNYSSVFGNTKGDTKNLNLFHKICTQESSPPNSEYCQTRSLCQVLQNEFMMQVGFICLQIALTAIPTIALKSGERAQTRIFLSLCCSMLLSLPCTSSFHQPSAPGASVEPPLSIFYSGPGVTAGKWRVSRLPNMHLYIYLYVNKRGEQMIL